MFTQQKTTRHLGNNRKPHRLLLRKQSLPPLKDRLAFQPIILASRRQHNILEWSEKTNWSNDQSHSPLPVTVDPKKNKTANTKCPGPKGLYIIDPHSWAIHFKKLARLVWHPVGRKGRLWIGCYLTFHPAQRAEPSRPVQEARELLPRRRGPQMDEYFWARQQALLFSE